MNRRVKIGFDANSVAKDTLPGIGSYTQRLIAALAKEGETSDIQFVGYYFDFLGKRKPKFLPKAKNIKYKRVIFYPGALVNILRRLRIDVPVEFFLKTKCDYVIFPNYLAQPSLFKAKKIPVIHDLTHLYFPEFMSDKNKNDLRIFLPKTLKNSAALISVSQTTKNDIIKEYGYEKPILVTPIPYERDTTPRDLLTRSVLTNKFDLKEKYLLFVGTLEPRKNVIKLLEAYEKSEQLHSNYSLVLCGGTDWKFEKIVQKISELQNKGYSVITTGFVSQKLRDSLYVHCSLFVQPSHYEGFGMPILEASSYKKPLAISDIPIFHEVAQDYAFYFNQNDPQSIADTILRALNRGKHGAISTYMDLEWHDIAKSFFSFIRSLK